MAQVVITLKIMPESPDTSLEKIEKNAREIINKEGEFVKKEIKPVAFGLNELDMVFLLDEKKASIVDKLEERIKNIKGVANAEIVDVRRTLG
ncbi:MAG: elongation factor 1-beta [Candidatus Pacearchaeota archaeon]